MERKTPNYVRIELTYKPNHDIPITDIEWMGPTKQMGVFVAGELVSMGDLIYIGDDGKIYRAGAYVDSGRCWNSPCDLNPVADDPAIIIGT